MYVRIGLGLYLLFIGVFMALCLDPISEEDALLRMCFRALAAVVMACSLPFFLGACKPKPQLVAAEPPCVMVRENHQPVMSCVDPKPLVIWSKR